MKRILSLALISILLNFIITPISSANSAIPNEQLDVVILVDISGSMNDRRDSRGRNIAGSDPNVEVDGIQTRFTIEAIQNLVWNCPPQVDMNVSLVVFNDNPQVITESPVNVNRFTNPNGVKDIEDYLQDILGMAWNGNTNIVGALREAKRILWSGDDVDEALQDDEREWAVDDSVTKGIILFTDGEHNVPPLTMSNGIAIVERFTQSESNHFYSVGLHARTENPNVSVTFNQEFLENLGGSFIVNPNIGQNLTSVTSHLEKIFAGLVPDIHPVGDTINYPMDGTVQSFPFDVYGEITSVVTVTITTENTKLQDIRILLNGNEVPHEINIPIETPWGEVTVRQFARTVNVNILEPSDGKWEIHFKGETGTARITRLRTHRLSLRRDENNIFLFNELSQSRVTLQRVYEDSVFTSRVIEQNGQRNVSSSVSENGFMLDLSNLQSGRLPLSASISLSRYNEFTGEDEEYFPTVSLLDNDFIDVPCRCGLIHCNECTGKQKCDDSNCIECFHDCKCGLIHCEECENNIKCEDETCLQCHCVCKECGCYNCFDGGKCDICGCENCFNDGNCGECLTCTPIGGGIALFIICVVLIVVFIIMMKKVRHKIKFENTEDLFYVTHKSPLIITANESADHDNSYVVSSHNYESLRGLDLAKIEAVHSLIPMPIFYRKLKITSLLEDSYETEEENDRIEMDATVDNPIMPQDDIALIFNSNTGESLTLKFDYFIKSSPTADDDDNDIMGTNDEIIGFESGEYHEEEQTV
jgi:hypothetical protein